MSTRSTSASPLSSSARAVARRPTRSITRIGDLLRKDSDQCCAGDDLAEVHARDEAAAEQAASEVLAAYELGDEAGPEPGILLGVMT